MLYARPGGPNSEDTRAGLLPYLRDSLAPAAGLGLPSSPGAGTIPTMTPARRPEATYSFGFWVVLKKAEDVPGQWVAHCLDIDVVSQGNSLPHAIEMINEAMIMTLVDDLQHGRNPLERSAPKKFWDELWEVVKNGQRLTVGDAQNITNIQAVATPVFLVVEKYAPAPKGAAKNRLPADISVGIEPQMAFAFSGA